MNRRDEMPRFFMTLKFSSGLTKESFIGPAANQQH